MKYFFIAAFVAVLSTLYTPKTEAAMKPDWCMLYWMAREMLDSGVDGEGNYSREVLEVKVEYYYPKCYG